MRKTTTFLLTVLVAAIFFATYTHNLNRDAQAQMIAIRYGSSTESPIYYEVGLTTAAINPGTLVYIYKNAAGENSGYILPCAAGQSTCLGVAMSHAPISSTSGTYQVMVNTSTTDLFYLPIDNQANIAQTRVGNLVDIADATSVDLDASTDDVFQVHGIIDGATYDSYAIVRLNSTKQGF